MVKEGNSWVEASDVIPMFPTLVWKVQLKAEFHDAIALAPEKLAIVEDGMWAVVNEVGGTAYGSRVAGVEIGGKTGTAQVVGKETTVRAGADPDSIFQMQMCWTSDWPAPIRWSGWNVSLLIDAVPSVSWPA